ncbi:MAG: PepSY-associated TM helix domain-containing protein [Methylophilaceae bacterium]
MFRLQTWDSIHRWSSLICTISLLILCLTGLPLIFHEEIESLTDSHPTATNLELPQDIDATIEAALADHPNKVIQYIAFNDGQTAIANIATGPATNADPSQTEYSYYNTHTAKKVDMPPVTDGVMWFLLELHRNLILGLNGALFLGSMGFFFLVSLISGVLLYAPFMRKLEFGEVRTKSTSKLKWLDLHNLFGIATVAWALVVCLTGVINTLSTPIASLWQSGQLAEMTAPYQNLPLVTEFTSAAGALTVAQSAAPDMEPFIIAYPGTPFSSKHHYAIFMQGKTPLTSRLLTPALIDAKTGELTVMRAMPWYVSTMFISQPLHFGDYGGLPLKIIWAIFDVITIIILISGVYLWMKRWKNQNHIRTL